MGLAKRIIPCLDVDNGRVVKGVKFVDIRDAGDPVEVARRYNEEGADEITFLDITASSDDRETIVHVVEDVASEVFIPLTVGGGIRTVEDIRRMLNAGADKVSTSSAAFRKPEVIAEMVKEFGPEKVTVAIDVDQNEAMPSGYEVWIDGGRTATGTWSHRRPTVLDCQRFRVRRDARRMSPAGGVRGGVVCLSPARAHPPAQGTCQAWRPGSPAGPWPRRAASAQGDDCRPISPCGPHPAR